MKTAPKSVKSAVVKSAAKKTAAKPAQEVTAQAEAWETAYNGLHAALAQRKAFCFSLEEPKVTGKLQKNYSQTPIMGVAIKNFTANMFKSAYAKLSQTDWANVASIIAYVESEYNKDKYMQVKSIAKLIQIIESIGKGLTCKDNYIDPIMYTLVENENHANCAELICTLSSKAREDVNQFAVRDSIKVRRGFTKGTATSQTGQIRDLLRVLGLANVKKGGKNSEATLNEYGVSVLSPIYSR